MAQACFQHVKTNYRDEKIMKKRIVYENATSPSTAIPLLQNITTTPTITLVYENGTLQNTTELPMITETVKVIEEYYETVTIRGLKYGDGINVLG